MNSISSIWQVQLAFTTCAMYIPLYTLFYVMYIPLFIYAMCIPLSLLYTMYIPLSLIYAMYMRSSYICHVQSLFCIQTYDVHSLSSSVHSLFAYWHSLFFCVHSLFFWHSLISFCLSYEWYASMKIAKLFIRRLFAGSLNLGILHRCEMFTRHYKHFFEQFYSASAVFMSVYFRSSVLFRRQPIYACVN